MTQLATGTSIVLSRDVNQLSGQRESQPHPHPTQTASLTSPSSCNQDNLSPLPENTPTLSPLVFLQSEATPIGLWNFFPHRSSQNGFREL